MPGYIIAIQKKNIREALAELMQCIDYEVSILQAVYNLNIFFYYIGLTTNGVIMCGDLGVL